VSTPSPAPIVPPAPAAIVISPTLAARIETLVASVEAKLKADEASTSSIVSKYWPVAVGVAIAATRFL
jgi:hypothetical protein